MSIEPVEQINITATVARWLMDTCIGLVRHYLGREFNPEMGTFTERNPELPAMEDRIPIEDYELRFWSSAVINLVTTIAGILNNAINANNLLRLNQILPTDDDSIDPHIGREI